jgi:tetratricopeptide (TPR) repeat protein
MAQRGAGEPIAEIEARLARYPARRYPVQHATAQFHRGGLLLEAGRLEEAEEALRVATRLFDGLSAEQAKARVMLGVVLRASGRLGEATEAFSSAGAVFEAEELPLERAAATFNVGLVRAQAGEADEARACFEQARELFSEHGAPGRAAAAGRELGAVLLATGEPAAAVTALEVAAATAERAGDQAGRGQAANILGLALLAAGRVEAAVEALTDAVAAHPRSVRPESYAMVKANLALGYQAAGDGPRSRLAARQALGVPDATRAVRYQAEGVLESSPGGDDDLGAVLDQEPTERWLPLVREEVVRWVDAEPEERRHSAGTWVDSQLARPDRAVDLAEAWLGVLLEMPPPVTDDLVRTTVACLDDHSDGDRERFRRAVARATARFNVPQLLRLQATFSRIAEELGQTGSWR